MYVKSKLTIIISFDTFFSSKLSCASFTLNEPYTGILLCIFVGKKKVVRRVTVLRI